MCWPEAKPPTLLATSRRSRVCDVQSDVILRHVSAYSTLAVRANWKALKLPGLKKS
jgi:hypothetical protein